VCISPHVPVVQSEKDENSYTLKLGTILHEGINYVPFYTAPQRIPAGQRCSQIPAKVFFEVTRGFPLSPQSRPPANEDLHARRSRPNAVWRNPSP
jgi:hypothetical protein